MCPLRILKLNEAYTAAVSDGGVLAVLLNKEPDGRIDSGSRGRIVESHPLGG